MKRLVFAAALSFAAFAFADTVSGTDTYGVLKIADTTHATVVVCVPWIGVNGSAIKVSDLIMTSNRKNGDVLYYYDSGDGEYRAWEFNEITQVWEATDEVSAGGVTLGTEAEDQTAARGDALIIVRQPTDASADPLTYPEVYLYGKYTADSASTEITAGNSAAPVYNLIAPPNGTEGCNMNSVTCTGTIDAKDRIRINNDAKQYQYVSGSGWGYYTVGDNGMPSFQPDLTIPAGEGAWYISKGGNPTFTW